MAASYACSVPGSPLLQQHIVAALASPNRTRQWTDVLNTVVPPSTVPSDAAATSSDAGGRPRASDQAGGDGPAPGAGTGPLVDLVWAPYSTFQWKDEGIICNIPVPGSHPAIVSALCPSAHPLRTALVSKTGVGRTMAALTGLVQQALVGHGTGPEGDGRVSPAALHALHALSACWLPTATVSLGLGVSLVGQVKALLASSAAVPHGSFARNVGTAAAASSAPPSSGPAAGTLATTPQPAPHHGNGHDPRPDPGHRLGHADPLWVVKEPSTNNALGVHIVAEKDLLRTVSELAVRMSGDEDDDSDGTDLEAHDRGAGQDNGPRHPPARPTPALQVQAYANSPFLIDGLYKFHIRVNVLTIGCMAVYVHHEHVVHVACKPLFTRAEDGTVTLAPVSDTYAHITNNVMQRSHPDYSRTHKTLTLEDACERLRPTRVGGDVEQHDEQEQGGSPTQVADMLAAIHGLVAGLFAGLLAGRSNSCSWPLTGTGLELVRALESASRTRLGHGEQGPASDTTTTATASLPIPGFVPSATSFELFGLDLMLATAGQNRDGHAVTAATAPLEAAGGSASRERALPYALVSPSPFRLVLLEVNGGPALESRAWPELCGRVVEDTLQLVADQFISSLKNDSGPSTAPVPPPGNGYVRVL